MSLDIYLEAVRLTTVWDGNITHNLGKMASEVNELFYKILWCPDELGIEYAADAIPYLRTGLVKLKSDPEYYKKFNLENKWGDYDGLVDLVTSYLEACEHNPDAHIHVSR